VRVRAVARLARWRWRRWRLGAAQETMCGGRGHERLRGKRVQTAAAATAASAAPAASCGDGATWTATNHDGCRAAAYLVPGRQMLPPHFAAAAARCSRHHRSPTLPRSGGDAARHRRGCRRPPPCGGGGECCRRSSRQPPHNTGNATGPPLPPASALTTHAASSAADGLHPVVGVPGASATRTGRRRTLPGPPPVPPVPSLRWQRCPPPAAPPPAAYGGVGWRNRLGCVYTEGTTHVLPVVGVLPTAVRSVSLCLRLACT